MKAIIGETPSSPKSGKQVSSADQRRFRRFGVKLPCRVKARSARRGAAASELEVETQDVSRGGMFFLTSSGLSIGTVIEFELDLPELVAGSAARIRCRGTVTRVVPKEEGQVGIGATIDHYRISQTPPQPQARGAA
jgi:c-di-GMP-binding flagellar brake protein YcgR